MTNITISRAIVEQALEALENCTSEYGHRCNRCDSEVDEGGRVVNALRAALAQQAEPVEPVAWMHVLADGYKCVTGNPIQDWTPLYTAPPQRKPLTEGALMGAYIDFDRTADTAWSGVEYLLRLCRTIERAHGITDPQVEDRLARHGIPMPDDENPSF
jgi:hypothetical protein